MGVPPPGGGDNGGGLGGGRGIRTDKSEYDRTVNCNTTDYGPLQGGSAEAGDGGLKEVVVTGGVGLGGDAGG